MRKILLAFMLTTLLIQPASAFTQQQIQQGAFGDDVIELQARLQYLGYYKGQID